jgi:hypothetical protein
VAFNPIDSSIREDGLSVSVSLGPSAPDLRFGWPFKLPKYATPTYFVTAAPTQLLAGTMYRLRELSS